MFCSGFKLAVALLCVLLLGALWRAGPVSADRGMIRPATMLAVNLEEPAQRAIIAHDGCCREIIILQTDVRASADGKIVEFMPLPSKPAVSLAPEGCFRELQDIIRRHGLAYPQPGFGKLAGRADGLKAEQPEAVKVVVSAQLGPHGITAVEVADADAFVKWTGDFFAKNKLGEPAVDEGLRAVVADYLRREIRYFVFDIVEVSRETRTVQPVAYEFLSPRIYYPLKVTNLYGGTGVVELLSILPPEAQAEIDLARLVPAALRQPGRFLASNRVTLAEDELSRLHPGIPGLMDGGKGILQAVRYTGDLEFTGDVQLMPPLNLTVLIQRFFWAAGARLPERLESATGLPFLADGGTPLEQREQVAAHFQQASESTRCEYMRMTIREPRLCEATELTAAEQQRLAQARRGGRAEAILARLGNREFVFLVDLGRQREARVIGFRRRGPAERQP